MTSDARSYKPLAILRIGAALIVLVQLAVLWSARALILDDNGLVPWTLGEALIDPVMPRLSWVAKAVAPLGIGSHGAVTLVLALQLIAGVGLLLGWRTRLFAALAWVAHLVIIGSSPAYTYGLGKMLVIALFYCWVMPVGREWSLDARRRAAPVAGDEASISILVLRLHMCIIYAAAGFSKAAGEQWWSGEAVWRALSLPQFQQFEPSFFGGFPLALQALAIASVVVQLAFPILVWTRLRVLIVVLAEALHLGIAIFLGLWLFSALMIVLNAAAFGEAIWRRVEAWLGARDAAPAKGAKVTIVYDGACPFCSDYVRYQDLRAASESVELVDARADRDALARYGIEPVELEDGMVVIVDGVAHHGADAVHALSHLSARPGNWWVAGVAAASRGQAASRLLYPFLKLGRRIALTALGVPRFSNRSPETRPRVPRRRPRRARAPDA
jgi:predicted DCC family thiol-disulfide oxidoreductase YuxK